MRKFINLFESMSRGEALRIFAFGGVDAKSMSKDELKLAKRKLSKKFHPDTGGSTETMAKINAAYDVLIASSGFSAGRPKTGYTSSDEPSRHDYRDLRYVVKHLGELSDGPRKDTTVWNFDGHFFRGCFSLHVSENVFPEIVVAMRTWDSSSKSRAIFVTVDGGFLLIWSDGKLHSPPIPFEHDSFNLNPGNDQTFVRKLPEMLDKLREAF